MAEGHGHPLVKIKIALTGNACSRSLSTVRSQDLLARDIRRVVGEIASYHIRDY